MKKPNRRDFQKGKSPMFAKYSLSRLVIRTVIDIIPLLHYEK